VSVVSSVKLITQAPGADGDGSVTVSFVNGSISLEVCDHDGVGSMVFLGKESVQTLLDALMDAYKFRVKYEESAGVL